MEIANRIKTYAETSLSGLRGVIVPPGGEDGSALKRSALIVTVGFAAARDSLARCPGVPTLATLVPRQGCEALRRQEGALDNRSFSAIYLDQPLSRQFGFIKTALPSARTVGVITSAATAALTASLRAAADAVDLRLAFAQAEDQTRLFLAMQRLMPDIDVLLALPDPAVINAQLIQSVLLTTYRYRVPVIGYSASYVDAGMLGAVFSTPAQIAQQANEIIAEMAKGGRWSLPDAAYPKYFSIKLNRAVARSLDIAVPDEPALLKHLIAGGDRS